ncbi:MAG: glycosyltransferase family 39 protein [Xenococcaceae cyanobacterium MO_234.B1]|nr:glycosyltransferase family 39 protein [Xenococcaceae cyanobacterium MO_234.B1]
MIFRQMLSAEQSLDKTKASSFKQYLFVAIYLLLLSTTVRLPFFFPAVINWDESTFILMGQSILDGHLPYTNLWDNKPPLAFVFYAFFIALLGKSIISVRIAGTLCVASVSFCTYLVGKTLWNSLVGIISATLFVVLASLLPAGQATMTEHVALVPLVGALSLLVTRKTTLSTLFFSGILMAIASLIRLNLAYVTIIIGLFALFVKPPRSNNSILQRGLAYAGGSGLVILLTYLPYVVTGYQQVWFSSVILAPLNYANSQLSVLEVLAVYKQYIQKSLSDVRGTMFGISLLVWIGGLMGIGSIFIQWFNASREKRLGLLWLCLFLFGTGISVLKGGAARSHYLIQLAPFIALTGAAFLNTFLHGYVGWLTISIIIFVLGVSVKPIITKYQSLVSRLITNQKLTYGSAYEIAAYLNQENILREPIYMMSDHIVYWLVDQQPLTKSSTHPSNITKDYLLKIVVGSEASTEGEMRNILTQKPKFIVRQEYIWYLKDKPQAKLLLENTLNQNYELIKQIRGKQIYRRLN